MSKVYVVGSVALLGIFLSLWAVWLWWLLLVGCVLWAAWHGWHVLRDERASLRMQEAELRKIEADAAKAQVEVDLLRVGVERAKVHLPLIPDGYIGTMAEARPIVWTYKQEVSPAVVRLDEQAGQLAIAAALPSARSVYEVLPTLASAAGRILLGYDSTGACWLSVDELLSVAMAGNSGRGKSRALLWLTLQLMRSGVTVVILDGKGDLRRWLSAYHAVAYTPSDIKQSVDTILLEADWRLRMSADDADASYKPIIIIIDELDLVLGRCEQTLDLIELLTKKTRSVNMHGIYSNQSVPADLVGGVATRGVIVSRICFYCDDEAARMLGVRANNGAAALLQQLAPPAPAGLAVARTAAFGWKLLAFPFPHDQSIPYLLDGVGDLPADTSLPMKPVSLSADLPRKAPILPVSEREREREKILTLAAEGYKPYVIARMMGKAGAFAEEVKRVLQEEAS